MCSDALKRRLVFGYRVANNFGLKQLSTIVKSFITKALEYKAVFTCLIIICMHRYAFLSDELLFT